MELHPRLVGVMGVNVDVVDPLCTEVQRPSDQPVNFITFVEEEFIEVRAILAGEPGDHATLCGGGACPLSADLGDSASPLSEKRGKGEGLGLTEERKRSGQWAGL